MSHMLPVPLPLVQSAIWVLPPSVKLTNSDVVQTTWLAESIAVLHLLRLFGGYALQETLLIHIHHTYL